MGWKNIDPPGVILFGFRVKFHLKSRRRPPPRGSSPVPEKEGNVSLGFSNVFVLRAIGMLQVPMLCLKPVV
jgi:hypothetical protein